MLRALVAIGFLVVSALMIGGAFFVGTESNQGALYINLGTEIFGILITVALVEWLFERRRLQDRARELGWSVFHSLERAVWVWQGGPRQMGSDALLGLIHGIKKSDPLPEFTRTLLVTVGTQSREALDKETLAIRLLPGMKGSLEDLTSLRSLTDGDSAVSIRMVTEVLESATTGLARVLHLSTQSIPAALIRYRDSSEEAQEERYYHGKNWTPKAEAGSPGRPPAQAPDLPTQDRPRTA